MRRQLVGFSKASSVPTLTSLLTVSQTRRWNSAQESVNLPTAAVSDTAQPNDVASSSSVFSVPLFDVGMGSAYYAFHNRDETVLSHSRRLSGSTVSSSAPGAMPLQALTSQQEAVRRIRGALGSVTVDLSVPPITAEQASNWRADRHLYATTQPIFMYPNAKKTVFLLPPHAQVTSLGTRMDAVDRVYRQKGLFTPSEVAQVFFTAVPSYYVESTEVFRALPPSMVFCLDSLYPRGSWVAVLLARYPMLFKLKRPKYAKSIVKLNSDVWFVRAHPLYKAADRRMRAHNVEYRAHAGGMLSQHVPCNDDGSDRGASHTVQDSPSKLESSCVSGAVSAASLSPPPSAEDQHLPIDLRIFHILLRHLPRVPTSADGKGAAPCSGMSSVPETDGVYRARYTAVPLVNWINSFTQEELDTLNSVPQERVVTVLNKYIHVFQITSHAVANSGNRTTCIMDVFAHNLFIDRTELIENVAHAESDAAKGQTSHLGLNVVDDCQISSRDSAAALTRPEMLMREALQDDMVGLAGLVSAHMQGNDECSTENDPTPVKEDRDVEPALAGVEDADKHSDEDNLESTFDGEVERDGHHTTVHQGNRIPVHPVSAGEREGDRSFHEDLRGSEEDTAGMLESTARFDVMLVRRLPPDIAPRSLSNFDEHTSPDPGFVHFVARFLNPPPSLASKVGKCREENIFDRAQRDLHAEQTSEITVRKSKFSPLAADASRLWRWVPVARIYDSLPTEARRHLRRRYRGLVNFLRLHGALFALSTDYAHVIAHDPHGLVPPLIPTQKCFALEERVVLPASFDDDGGASAALLGEETRRHFATVLGTCQVPTTRQQLVLLDPRNPLLHHVVLEEEIAALLPAKGSLSTASFMRSLPPLIRAVLPVHFQLSSNPHIVQWEERGVSMVQRRELGNTTPTAAAAASAVSSIMGAEEAIEALRESVPRGGATVRALIRLHVPVAAQRALKEHYGGVLAAAAAFPHYFHVTHSNSTNSRADTLVEVIDG